MNEIVVRKDLQRIRKKVLARIRKGKRQAEVNEERRIQKIVARLRHEGIRPELLREDDMADILVAIIRECGEAMHIDAIIRMVNIVANTDALQNLVKLGQLSEKIDSYGRKCYSNKRTI